MEHNKFYRVRGRVEGKHKITARPTPPTSRFRRPVLDWRRRWWRRDIDFDPKWLLWILPAYIGAISLLILLMHSVLPRVLRYYYTRPLKDAVTERNAFRSGSSQYRLMQRRFNRAQNSMLYRHLKIVPLPNAYYMAPETYEELLSQTKDNDLLKFYCYSKLAYDSFHGNDFKRAARFYREALSIKPDDAIINSGLARAYERIGDGEHAIEYYEAAARDDTNTAKLKAFFLSQAIRVKKKGPAEWRPKPIY